MRRWYVHVDSRRLGLLRSPFDADDEHTEDGNRLRNDGSRRLQEVEERHEHHVVCAIKLAPGSNDDDNDEHGGDR
jgi:hypothetical protein